MSKLDGKIGFIGAGNMGLAILSGMLRAQMIEPAQAIVSDASVERLAMVERLTQAVIARNNAEVARDADVVLLAVKPFQVSDVCAEIRDSVHEGQLFITICAGIPTALLEEKLGPGVRVVRVMPNTPSMIGCGSAGVAAGARATRQDIALVVSMFEAVGKAIVVQEDQMDLITGLTGSGPAYVYYFMESLIGAATKLGLSEADAKLLVGEMVQGAARMAMESEQPLPELRRMVATKGGTTEAGLRVLEEGGFADVIARCVTAATSRSRELAKG